MPATYLDILKPNEHLTSALMAVWPISQRCLISLTHSKIFSSLNPYHTQCSKYDYNDVQTVCATNSVFIQYQFLESYFNCMSAFPAVIEQPTLVVQASIATTQQYNACYPRLLRLTRTTNFSGTFTLKDD